MRGVAVSLAPALALLAASAPARADPPDRVPRTFLARGTVGFGPAIQSEQQDLLDQEGYSAGRWLFSADGLGRVGDRWAVGGFAGGAYRSTSPRDSAPTLVDSAWFVGAEGAALFGQGTCGGIVVARSGFMRGSESFHGAGRGENAFAFGGELGFLCMPVSVMVGALLAPAAPPGDAGRSWDMGAFYLSVGVVFHD